MNRSSSWVTDSRPGRLANVIGQHLRNTHLREVPAHQQPNLDPGCMRRHNIAEKTGLLA